mmetsp:Transcript_2466/g.4470  ORF Transcript_2466/g.4470 Transcript_2466/m.4470 type:complete len:97 (+) Transcript_2466:163-453(+)
MMIAPLYLSHTNGMTCHSTPLVVLGPGPGAEPFCSAPYNQLGKPPPVVEAGAEGQPGPGPWSGARSASTAERKAIGGWMTTVGTGQWTVHRCQEWA